MSYHRSARGLGSLDPTPKSYYVALIETYNTKTHIRSYAWTPYYYMGFWDMNSWSFTLEKDLPGGLRQAGKIYQWDGRQWLPTAIDDTITM